MNKLTVRRLPNITIKAAQVPNVMDEAGIEFVPIDCNNWADSYPYHPKAEFRIAHNGSEILLHYRAYEAAVRAEAEADGGRVWEDSCMEFFFSPAADGLYYNLESNCAATVLLAVGDGRAAREKAQVTTMTEIDRWASLGRQPFSTIEAPHEWQLALVVPLKCFFRHDIQQLSGLEARANFYKCGDLLPQPHFLSWSPINTPKPDFHRPEFFGRLIFE